MSPQSALALAAPEPAPLQGREPSRIPLCVPELQGNEWAYVKECLDTNWVSSVGPFVDRFEEDFAATLGMPHAVATVNGTAALHVALLVAGVRPDDEVLMPSLSFIAPANAVRYASAWPVFIDAEPATWQIDPQRLGEYLKHHCRRSGGMLVSRTSGRRVAAILPVHLLGHPVDMAAIRALAKEYGLPVVEDAAESLGARYDGQPVGTLGDIACFSFNGNKLMTTGGGGMIVTANPEWAERARYLSTTAKDDAVEGIHASVGYNYRLTNLQAALGCAQLERLPPLLAAKRRIAGRYESALASLPRVTAMPEADWAESAYWLYTIRVAGAEGRPDRRALRERLAQAGIETRLFWQPLHQSPAHRVNQVIGGAVAELLHAEMLSLPCSAGLSDDDQDRVIAALGEALDG
jgi:perosamine synthetase